MAKKLWCEKRFQKWANVAGAMLGWKETHLVMWEQYAHGGGTPLIHIGGKTAKEIRKQIVNVFQGNEP